MAEFKEWKTSCIKDMELLIFDCDGTLIDTLHSHYLTWKESYERKGAAFVSEDDFRKNLAGISNAETVTLLNKRFGHTFSPTEIYSLKEENFVKYHAFHTKPIEKVLRIARQNYGKIPMVVASGGQRETVNLMLESNHIRYLFEEITTAEDVARGKPEPDLFLEAARKAGVKPEKCFVFEDSGQGFEAAKRAGMDYFNIHNLPDN